MLLTDTFIIEDLQVLSESKANGTMKISGIFQRADEPNNNNRIYEKKLLMREMSILEEAVKDRRLMGELDHPSYDSVKLQSVSHLITKLDMRGNEVIGEAEILGTPAGLVAQALIRGGVKIGISSRGKGTLSDAGSHFKVNENFKLITWDLVADPSTKGAYPGLMNESVDSQFIEDTVRSTFDQALSEKVFITMLKNELYKK